MSNWQRFKQHLFYNKDLGMQIDYSRVNFSDNYLTEMEPRMQNVYRQIMAMEGGAAFNPDEGRMVGHYWLRAPELAPTIKIKREIAKSLEDIKFFASQIQNGSILGGKGRTFLNLLIIGVGGSGLGARFVFDALIGNLCLRGHYFIDNTDPDGMDQVFTQLRDQWDRTLTMVVSKSGETVEVRNSMEEVKCQYKKRGFDFNSHAVCITQSGSLLDKVQNREGWLRVFYIWDWVGGRTSVFSAVGLAPLALRGININDFLEGAKECDRLTRKTVTRQNPAALLALMWYAVTKGKNSGQMIILPYKDCLRLLGIYLQQLIMESLGKERDLDGKLVHQGITVFGNKGTTDQHSYLQQLLEGPDNVLVTFIEILKDRRGDSVLVAENSTSGDYLQAFMLSTRNALSQRGRSTITLTFEEVNERTLGAMIALFERAVGIYALLVNINAYHQPAVESIKKGVHDIIE